MRIILCRKSQPIENHQTIIDNSDQSTLVQESPIGGPHFLQVNYYTEVAKSVAYFEAL